jgi:hypothetical protein
MALQGQWEGLSVGDACGLRPPAGCSWAVVGRVPGAACQQLWCIVVSCAAGPPVLYLSCGSSPAVNPPCNMQIRLLLLFGRP